MLADIEIAQRAEMLPIEKVAESIGIGSEDLELYGKYKAKVTCGAADGNKENGRLILVTAINPTPAGEGKTTVTIGLGDALRRLGKKSIIALREPSMGPVFGIKGGAAGGGYSQVVPMEDINLHFTGDMHAVGAANNLLAALIDNHIAKGNKLNIDVTNILWKRCVDMNDRALRSTVIGMGGTVNGIPREEGFMITVASEVMAILCLADGISDLKERLGNIIVATNRDGDPVYCRDLNAQGAMAAILKDAIKPNLVQTLEHTPAFVHGGPFANIAHGCNSVAATKLAVSLGDYTVTEAGFGADLGAEKFMDIKCKMSGLRPDAAVIVATVRALKYNGGADKNNLAAEDLNALSEGLPNLGKHIENMKAFGLPIVVAINRFATDTDAELAAVKKFCEKYGVGCSLCEVFAKGGEGGLDLAQQVIDAINSKKAEYHPPYDDDDSLEDKVSLLVRNVYGGRGANFSKKAKKTIRRLKEHGLDQKPICIAKTQYSLSDDPTLLGRPRDFKIDIKTVRISNGAGFIVCETGNIMVMPGLPSSPAAERIDIDENGVITGLF